MDDYDFKLDMLRKSLKPEKDMPTFGGYADDFELAQDVDVGARLDLIDDHDKNFHLIVEDMICGMSAETKIMEGTVDLGKIETDRTNDLQPIQYGDPAEKWKAVNLQNEQIEANYTENNGGIIGGISYTRQTTNTPEPPAATLCDPVPETRSIVDLPTDTSNSCHDDRKDDEGGDGKTVDA